MASADEMGRIRKNDHRLWHGGTFEAAIGGVFRSVPYERVTRLRKFRQTAVSSSLIL